MVALMNKIINLDTAKKLFPDIKKTDKIVSLINPETCEIHFFIALKTKTIYQKEGFQNLVFEDFYDIK